MLSRCFLVLALLSIYAYAQKPSTDNEGPGPNQEPPRSAPAADANDSSSRDSIIDLSPPTNDAKNHPDSDDSDQTQEFHPWDPHKADKNVEVGDFYFKRQNYHAAESRYREALYWKNDDAIASFRLAQCLEKLGKDEEALQYYQSYLKILPHGPDADESQKAITRLTAKLARPAPKETTKDANARKAAASNSHD
jgi:tetratricopeptide (TPR) repeat protein